MPHSFTDLAGLDVSAEDFLSAVLGEAGQPIWAVDRDDVMDRHGDGWEGVREGVHGDQGWPLYLQRFADVLQD